MNDSFVNRLTTMCEFLNEVDRHAAYQGDEKLVTMVDRCYRDLVARI